LLRHHTFMNDILLADQALEAVLQKYRFQTVLDIGCGQGLHSNIFRQHLKTVIGIDASTHWGMPELVADFLTHPFSETFDLVWCSHVLEHQPNARQFLLKVYAVLKPGGILAITVPPRKPNIVGGHVSIWNAGLLLYNLILAGFDCRDAMVRQYDYNISVVVRKSHATLPPLKMDSGDIELLAPYFPRSLKAEQDFSGDITEMQWNPAPDPRPPAGPVLDARTLSIQHFVDLPEAHVDDLDALLWCLSCAELPGDIAEFGVFQGRSLRAMAEHQPLRTVHGFDSFLGLPEDWVRSTDSTYSKGHFSTGALPPLQAQHRNIQIHPGFFDASLPVWQCTLRQPLALLHIDADLFSSSKYVLDTLNDAIAPGTVIVFDELSDWKNSGVYPRWEEGEWRALKEWMQEHGRRVRVLARGTHYSGAVVVAV